MKRFCVLLLLLGVLNIGVSVADAQWMPDTNLRNGVRRALGFVSGDVLTKRKILDLTEFNAANLDISDLSGLEFATNLVELNLNGNSISDLSALSGLENLTHLYLRNNDITDVEPLRDLTQLEVLWVANNSVSDVEPLRDLTQLEVLWLTNNSVSDISALAGLVNLRDLRFRNNSVSDVSALEGLVNLRSLRFPNNSVSDVAPLSGLENLRVLQLAGNRITNTGPLAGLVSNLKSPIDIVVFPDRNLEVLVRLELGAAEDEMVTPELMAQLTRVSISRYHGIIRSLGGLEHATNLEELIFTNAHTARRDLTPLAGLAHLRHVALDGRNIALETLLSLSSLTRLRIAHDANLTDMTIVSQLTSLERLDFAFNKNLRDLTGLENLENLTRLTIVGSYSASDYEAENLTAANALSDISSLSALESLEYLSLDYNGISDLSPLSALANLERLYVRHNNVSDVSPLVGLTGLTTLVLFGNPVENAHVLYPLTQQDLPVDIDIDVSAPVAQDVDARPQVTEIRWPAAFVDLGDGLEYHTPPRDISDVLVDIIFSEDVTDFESDDIELLGTATIAAIDSLTGSGSEYTLTISITPTTDGTGDGTLGIHIPAGAVQDVSGDNDNIAYSTGSDAAALLFSPTLEIVVPEEPQNGAFDVVFEFNESVTGFRRNWVDNYFGSVMNAIGGTLTGWAENAAGTIYTATITPTVDGVFPIFRFAANQVLAENTDGLKVLDSVFSPRAVTVDLTPLKVTEIRWPAAFVDLGDGLEYHTPPRDISDVSVRITFSEDVTDFESDDIRLLGTATTAAIESVTGSGSKYTLTIAITPTTDGTGDGTLGIDIPAGAVQDVSGDNDNIAYSTGSDAAALLFSPTLEIVVPEEPQNGAFDVVFEFNESVTGFRRNWVDNYFGSVMNAIGGTLTGWNENATGTIYTATITPTVDGVFPIFRFAANQVLAENTDGLKVLDVVFSPRAVTIEISQWAPWDVNQDGVVDDTDAALVTAAIGQTGETIANPLTDVNGDGVVDRDDLLLVQEHLNTDVTGAPSTDTIVALLGLDTLKSLSRTSLETELNALIAETDGSLKYRRAIQFLQNFLLALRPDKTRLLANYPNPFNPETWIPYHLANASNVRITIYDTRGVVVRRLDLGHQREGYYTSRSRAAYWDGRNHVGERVASGIYFYQLEANDISRLRKMVILK